MITPANIPIAFKASMKHIPSHPWMSAMCPKLFEGRVLLLAELRTVAHFMKAAQLRDCLTGSTGCHLV